MENGQQEAAQALPGKKEMKKQLIDKMEAALPELRDMLGEKKFANRLKKAAKLLTEGLHKQDLEDEKQPKKTMIKKAATKKVATTKLAGKKAAAKKVPVKAAKKTAAKK